MSTSRTHDKFVTEFDPGAYLTEYYQKPDAEDRFITKFMLTALREMPPDLCALEFGGGPTLYAVAALAPQAREIQFCDFLTSNLEEVRRWLKNERDAFDWDPYVEMTLEEEGGITTPEAVAQRTALMRQKVTRLTTCDALARAPLGNSNHQYDLVVAHCSTDSAAATVAEWRRAMHNLSTLVLPGGWLLISVITGTCGYTVGPNRFPNVNLADEDIYQGYMAAGYDMNTYRFEKLKALAEHSYSGLTSATARKRNDPAGQTTLSLSDVRV